MEAHPGIRAPPRVASTLLIRHCGLIRAHVGIHSQVCLHQEAQISICLPAASQLLETSTSPRTAAPGCIYTTWRICMCEQRNASQKCTQSKDADGAPAPQPSPLRVFPFR